MTAEKLNLKISKVTCLMLASD